MSFDHVEVVRKAVQTKMSIEKCYKPENTGFGIFDGVVGTAFSLLAKTKKERFTIKKPTNKITDADIMEHLQKGLPSITRRDFTKFRESIKELKTSNDYTDDAKGFARYLDTIIWEVGYLGLSIIIFNNNNPQANPIDIAKHNHDFALDIFNYCTELATTAYQPPAYQHTPVDVYQQPNDKITKNLSTATKEELGRGQLVIDEKVGNIFSYINLYPEEVKKMGLEHINTFDLFVLFSCISIKAAGNTHTTINIIYKTMTGKSGEVKLTEKMRQELMQSIDKLRLTPITIDATGICAKYNHKPRGRYVKSYLLPAKMAGQGIVNGGYTEDVITFLDDSPLYEIAMMKNNQIFSINRDVFDVPKLKANKQNLTLRQVLATLTYDTGHSEKLKDGILIDTLMTRSEWSGTRARLVEAVEKCLEYWVEKQYLIKGYKIQKDKRGMAIKIYVDPLKS